MKILILVISCRAYRSSRQEAVLKTWAKSIPDEIDLWFVEGTPPGSTAPEGVGNLAQLPDKEGLFRLKLPVSDGYEDLAEKTFRAVSFALQQKGWEGVLKCDDDSYLHVPRLLAAASGFSDYQGGLAEGQTQFKPYACGGAYWLSRKAAMHLVQYPFESYEQRPWYTGRGRMRKRGEKQYREGISIEDVMTGDILADYDILPTQDKRFGDDPFPSVFEDPDRISSHYLTPAAMMRMAQEPQLQRRFLGSLRIKMARFWARDRRPK